MSKLLADLVSELDKGFIEETFEVKGHKFAIRLLTDGEVNWKNRFINAMDSSLALLSSRKAPTLAIAIRSIDDKSVVDVFAEDLEGEALAQYGAKSAIEKKFWAAEQLFNWLSNRPSDFTGELYAKYAELEERRGEVQKNLKNL